MAILKRGTKIRHEKRRPQTVTGSFELHYEDVVSRNRYALIALFASGLVLLAAMVPTDMYRSLADDGRVSLEAEQGLIIHPEYVTKIAGDETASGNSYIEFHVER